MKNKFYFLYLGLFSAIIQLVIIREFINLFYGNEFFVALSFFLWLLATGLGSLLYKRFKRYISFGPEIYFYIGIYFLVLIFLNRFLVGFIKNPGEGVDILVAFGLMAVELFPLCFIIGYIFPFFVEKYIMDGALSYRYENIGFLIGGVVFYLFLIKTDFVISTSILFFLASILIFDERKFLFIIGLFLSLILVIFNKHIDKVTLKNIFKNEDIVLNKYTPKGKLTITKRNDQFNFYYNNLIVSSDEETFRNEIKIHLPFLFASKKEKILFIGSPFSGILNEIYKYNPKKVIYLDIDEYILDDLVRYLKDEVLKYRVEKSFLKKDLYEFVLSSDERFDVIVLELPYPSSLGINRFYSKEFFEGLKRVLDETGIVSIYLNYSQGYVCRETRKANISMYKTLKSVFENVVFFPEEENIFVSFDGKIDSINLYLNKFNELRIKLRALSYEYLKYRFENDRIDELLMFIKNDTDASINSFMKPEIYVYNIINQIRVFYPWISDFYLFVMENRYIFLFFIFICFLSILYFVRKNNIERNLIRIFSLSFSVISLEIISIYLFEINFGKPIEGVSLIITFVMLGIAVGSSVRNCYSLSKYIFPLSILSVLGYFLFLKFSFKTILIFLIFFVGFVLGVSFAFFSKKDASRIDLLYGYDILGSVFGVILTSVLFIPLFGIESTFIILIVILFLSFMI